MRFDAQTSARVAIFVALAYVAALASFYIPNVSLIFIVVFAAGAFYGLGPGVIVGGMGMMLWTLMNPYGMAGLYMTITQVIGMALVGALGSTLHRSQFLTAIKPFGFWLLGLYGLLSGLIFQLLISLVLAWLFGPFWPSFYSNMTFALLTIGSNIVIFVVCYPLLVKGSRREAQR